MMNNRNSTPEATNVSSLRPPSSRAAGTTHALRASADMVSLTGSAAAGRIRPSSDFYGQSQQGTGSGNGDLDPQDKLAQQWIADIDQYETTLEEMAAATLDQDFKDELSAIEQWFRVLSEAERTAALYALLQQTTQVQIRFFIQVLQQMGKSHPMSGVLSPSNFDKDPMSNRLSDAMGKLNVDSARSSMTRPSAPSVKRHSGLDSLTINAMFPDAAAAIATEKAKFTQQTGNPPMSNRNSAVDPRSSLGAPAISASADESNGQTQTTPWGSIDASRPKSSAGQVPMGQFVQPPPSTGGGLRSPRPQVSGSTSVQHTTVSAAGDKSLSDMPLLSPYNAGSGNWASMVNTPMVPNFGQNQGGNQADMVANATAMKLAAVSTVNNRFALDDPRRFRRARSNDPAGQAMAQNAHGVGANFVMVNELGQVVSREQLFAMQQQQQQHQQQQQNMRRPNSPGIAVQNYGPALSFTTSQNNGFLTPFDTASSMVNNGLAPMSMSSIGALGAMGGMGSLGGMGAMGTIGSMGPMGSFGLSHEGYLSDHSDMNRGRSPRGRRTSSKPPEDPTDPSLLQDIPAWLRSLRLHKYTDNLKDLKWSDLVELDDKQLEDRGVNALGARRKMLKVFEQVKDAKADGKLA